MHSSSAIEAPAAANAQPQRWCTLVWLVAVAVLVLLLAILVALPGIATWLAPDAVNGATVAAVVLVPFVLLVIARRTRAGRWSIVGVGYLLIGSVYVWLAADDLTLRHNVKIDDLSPAFPGAEKSYAVLMRYGRNHALGRDFHAPSRIFDGKGPRFVTDITKSEEWRDWLLAHRTDIEADWADLAPVRAWWADLAQFDRIADLMPARFDTEFVAFQPVRSYAQHAVEIAGLQALDGHGDEAFATLQPLLEVSRNLEPSARSLVRIMIARVAQKMAVQAAGFVLDHATVSQAARAKFAAALAHGTTGEAGARRLLAVEYALAIGMTKDLHAGDIMAQDSEPPLPSDLVRLRVTRVTLNSLSCVLLNPVRSLNMYGDLSLQLQDLVAHRQLDRIDSTAETFFKTEAPPRMKNLYGRLLFLDAVPAFAKVAVAYWKIEDDRTALLARLQ